MLRAGHARFAAALIAAVMLHALLLLFPSSIRLSNLQPLPGAMRVELLEAHQASVRRMVRERPREEAQRKTTTRQPAKRASKAIESHVATAKSAAPAVAKRREVQAAPPMRKKQTQVAYEPSPAPSEPVAAGQRTTPDAASSESSPASGAEVMPDEVQARIVAHIRYPRQARRLGWQGRARFQLHVKEQTIGSVVLLASSGYGILDQAARKGIERSGRVPLADGNYLLPVEFRLQ